MNTKSRTITTTIATLSAIVCTTSLFFKINPMVSSVACGIFSLTILGALALKGGSHVMNHVNLEKKLNLGYIEKLLSEVDMHPTYMETEKGAYIRFSNGNDEMFHWKTNFDEERGIVAIAVSFIVGTDIAKEFSTIANSLMMQTYFIRIAGQAISPKAVEMTIFCNHCCLTRKDFINIFGDSIGCMENAIKIFQGLCEKIGKDSAEKMPVGFQSAIKEQMDRFMQSHPDATQSERMAYAREIQNPGTSNIPG